MPTVKTKRQDILRPYEIMETIKKAEPWLGCVISIAALFGKRITEILSLKRDQIIIKDDFLIIRFRVGKKREDKSPIPLFYIKRKTLKHPLTKFVTDYVEPIKQGYLFPFNREPREAHVSIMVRKKNGEMKRCSYTYQIEGGYISRQLAHYYLKKIAPDSWFHLFRESLATKMAEDGATEEDLMHWFDWETPASPHKYVKRGTKLTEKWSSNVDRDYIGMVDA